MFDCLLDGLFDTLKLIPYLLITFLLLELIEYKFNNNNQKILLNNKKYGPFFGGLLGALPQCGFSSMAANLFSAKIITIGTLIAVFLSTSDEMIPIMLSEKISVLLLIKIILFKMIIGILFGYIIDILYRKKKEFNNIKSLCEHEHCSCDHDGIIISSLKHTARICLFVLVTNLIINILIYTIGEKSIASLLLQNNIFTYFMSCLIGLIPNCAGSIIITELYLSNFISTGAMIAGLLTGSGLGILLLFRTNKNLKENIFILSSIYFMGVIVGILVDIFI